MREFDRAAALGENREQTSSDRGSTPLASTINKKPILLHGLFIYMESRGAEPEENAASGGRATKGSVSERTRPESSQRLRRDSPRLHQRQVAASNIATCFCGLRYFCTRK